MDSIRQSIVENLNYLLAANDIITEGGTSIIFFEGQKLENEIIGKIKVDNINEGKYQILFFKKLTLILSTNDNFKFTNVIGRPSNSIAIEGIDSNSIIELLKLIKIDY